MSVEGAPEPPARVVGGTDHGAGARFSAKLMHAAATLYYVRDETQADVAHSLGVSRATVSRLLAEARRLGIVRIEVQDLPDDVPAGLGAQLAEALGLASVHVAPAAHARVLRAALAVQVATALDRVGLGAGDVLLVSSGRTIWEVGQERLPALPGTVVTPMVGGQHEPEAWYQTNEITRVYAENVGGRPVFLHAPALPSPGLHERLVQDPGTKQVFELWGRARCALLGVGAPPSTRASMPDYIPRDADWQDSSAGDICTRFFDAEGEQLSYPGSEQLIATSYDTLRALPHTIAVATGEVKVPSLIAGARAEWFNTLVTDAPTATALLRRVEQD